MANPAKYAKIVCQAVDATMEVNMYGEHDLKVRLCSSEKSAYQFDTYESTYRVPASWGPEVERWLEEGVSLMATVEAEYSYMADKHLFIGGEVCDLVLDKD